MIVFDILVHNVLDRNGQLSKQLLVCQHAAGINETFGGQVPVGLHDSAHVLRTGLRRHFRYTDSK